MGDFHQFPPVKCPALWKFDPRLRNEDCANSKMFWQRFTNVVILDQQMRQSDDIIFQNLLHRARAAMLTKDDLTLLNSRVISSLLTPNLEAAATVVKLNYLRHHINCIRLEYFARARSQKIYIFPAHHS